MATKMLEKEFNLLYEPWIVVQTKDNQTKEWSILDTFKHAHEAQRLAGELPTQDVAIMRLLLAIMHGALVTSDMEDLDDVEELWGNLWEAKQFSYDDMETYLKQYEDRFWLFHPQYPFYQVADMGKSTEYTAGKLIGSVSESSNKIRLFSERSTAGKKQISYAEAARWLLYVNAFDDTSAKPTQKGLGSPGAGWLGKLGLVYAQGNTLFETLVLNFVLTDYRDELFTDHDGQSKAYWERDTISNAERVHIAQPSAQKTLLTLQSRRLQLKRDDGAVTGFKLLGGDYFDKENALNETMSLWRVDKKTGDILPKRHQSTRLIWRDMAALLASRPNEYEPGVVHWLKYLEEQGIYHEKFIKLCVTAVEYGDKDFFAAEILDDSIQMNAALLSRVGEEWIIEMVQAIAQTDEAVKFLGWFAVNMAMTEGNSDGNPKDGDTAKEQAYQQLDGAFRNWLLSIDPQQDEIQAKMAEWRNTAKRIVTVEGEKILGNCSDSALVGYIKKVKDKNTTMNAFIFFARFKAGLNKVLGKEV